MATTLADVLRQDIEVPLVTSFESETELIAGTPLMFEGEPSTEFQTDGTQYVKIYARANEFSGIAMRNSWTD